VKIYEGSGPLADVVNHLMVGVNLFMSDNAHYHAKTSADLGFYRQQGDDKGIDKPLIAIGCTSIQSFMLFDLRVA